MSLDGVPAKGRRGPVRNMPGFDLLRLPMIGLSFMHPVRLGGNCADRGRSPVDHAWDAGGRA